MSGAIAVARSLPRIAGRGAVREQTLVAAGQLLSGVGNMGFALICARLLAPGPFAELAAFLALFLLIHLPARSLSAGSALTPELTAGARRRTLRIGLLASAAVLVAGVPSAAALGLPVAMVAILAVTPALAGVLALERGRLFGERRHLVATATLIAEPVVRLTGGVALVAAWGAVGGAVGVVAGSAVAYLLARLARSAPAAAAAAGEAHGSTESRRSRAAVIAFLLLAVLQAQDIVFANATLPGSEAARFAVLSTLGGIAASATTTVPLVLLPQAKAGDRGALRAALLVAAGLGVAAIVPFLIAPEPLVALTFGDRYASLAGLAAPYLLAMALLGVARVLAANAAATGARGLSVGLAAAAVLQLALLVALGDSAGGVAAATLIAIATLTAGLLVGEAVRTRSAPDVDEAEAPEVDEAATPELDEPLAPPLDEPFEEPWTPVDELPLTDPPTPPYGLSASEPPAPRSRWSRWRVPLVLLGLMGLGIGLRLLADRSLWLDEATTWYQSQLPFHVLLDDLRTTDVHPPGHHVLVWLSVRAFGDGELALRLPSLVAGTAVIPMLYVAGRAMFDRRTGLIAAAIGTVAPIIVWYSEEARMYAQLMLLAVVAIWALYRAIESAKFRYWAIYALSTAALVWTHYFASLVVGVLEVAMIVMVIRVGRERGSLRRLAVGGALATAALAAALVPLVPFALDQFMANEAAGKGFSGPVAAGGAVDAQVSLYGALTNGIWALWGYHSNATMAHLTALWPLLILLALLVLGRGRSRPTYLLIAASAVPVLLLSAIAFAKPFLFELRYGLATVPFLVLLVAAAVSRWPKRAVGRWALGAVVVLTMAAGTIDQQANGSNPRVYDFEGALGRVSEMSGPGDVLVYDPDVINNVIEYYGPGLETSRLVKGGIPAGANRVFLLSSFRDKAENVNAVNAARRKLDLDRELIDRFDYPQVKVWVYQ